MLKDWVNLGREKGASDLHLESGTPLVLRVRGELMPVGEKISTDVLQEAAKGLLGGALWEEFLDRRSADLSRTISGARCRINIFQTVRGIGMAIRVLTSFQNNLNDCNLNPDLRRFTLQKTGLMIISGPTGSGKSTTLAALLEEINISSRRQIIAIESPVEYLFANRKSFIRQREVPTHSPSFEQAIIDAMRENPDVLVIGEMRTPDVMRLTLNAAETGHLVLATMHSSTCAEALSRICMSFPSEIQGSIRGQLADCLVGVVCQRLEYLSQHQIQVPVCEIMTASSAVKANIRSGQFSQLASAIQSGGEDGMLTFERYQRWIEQKKTWVRPSQAAPLDEREAAVSLAEPTSQLQKSFASPKLPSGSPIRRGPSPSSSYSPSKSGNSDPNRIEISHVDEDLEELGRLISKGDRDDESSE